MAIVTYAGHARVNLDPTPVTESNKEGLHGRVPGRAMTDNSSCYSCGMRAALDLVSDEVNTKTVFIVARGDNSHGEEMNMVEKAIEKKNIPVYGIVIGEEFVNKKEKIENNFYFISDLSDQQTQLSDVFLTIANGVGDTNDGYAKFYEYK